MTGVPFLRLEGVALSYGRKSVLADVDLDVQGGEVFAIVGRNGSGKSTLLAALLGTLVPVRGIREGAPRFGYSPQRGDFDPVFPFLCEEVVGMGLVGVGRFTRAERREKVRRVLGTTGLLGQGRIPFRDLSGGQRQRAMIARALVAEPEVLVLDEPTNNLDVQGQAEVIAVLRQLHAAGTTLILVSHDLGLVQTIADRVAVVRDQVVSIVSTEALADPGARAQLLGLSAAL